VFFPDRKVPVA